MTLENFKYRTDPLFLRNQFADSSDFFGIPTVPKPYFSAYEFDKLRMIGFDLIKNDNKEHRNRMVHFFLYDYNFEKVWREPQQYIEMLRPYKAVLTPDFSMYTEMPSALQLFNTFRNRWCGAYFAEKGLRVVPTVNWGLDDSFDFCFAGIEKGSAVAVSTYMFREHGNHSDQKDIFMNGYNEMLKRIEPEYVICYSEPFEEMTGNIIYVDYELSSWQHMDDDIVLEKDIKRTYGVRPYVCMDNFVYKGGGSAYGGKWMPKKEDEKRLIGKPGEIKDTIHDGYRTLTKIGEDGYAIWERHFTDHFKPKDHSNPHDHIITWENNHPNFKQVNYWDGNIPEFKSYIKNIISQNMEADQMNYGKQFETLGEFKIYLSSGANVGFEYNGTKYQIEKIDTDFSIWTYDGNDIADNLTLDEVMDYKLDGVKIKDLILTAEIIERLW